MAARVGQKAPYWEAKGLAPNGEFKDYKATDFEGKWLVLFFYPLDFTFVCPTEIRGFNEHLEEFKKLKAEVVAASTDSVYSHKAWTDGELGKVAFPILGDTNHEIARKFGVLVENAGIALRGTFLVDPQGVLRYSVVHDLNVGRSVDEALRVLQAFQTGELCPVGWKPGQKTLGK
jgi:alkyl hydroperoxide reductase subunit AhpC